MLSLALLTERLGDRLVRSGLSRGRTAEKELELGSTRAVAQAHSPGKLDAKKIGQVFGELRQKADSQITGGDVVAGDERGLLVHNLIHAKVGMEVGLNRLKDGNRPVSASTARNKH